MSDARLVTRLEDLVGKTIERAAITVNRFASETLVLRFTDETVVVIDGGGNDCRGWIEIDSELDDHQRYAIGLMTAEETATYEGAKAKTVAEQYAADKREFERLRRKLGR